MIDGEACKEIRAIANKILAVGRESEEDSIVGVMCTLELVILHVLVLTVDRVSYEEMIDNLAFTLKRHVSFVYQEAIEAGILDEVKPN
jgi:hypothetical protein